MGSFMTPGMQKMSHFLILLSHMKYILSFFFSKLSETSKFSVFQCSSPYLGLWEDPKICGGQENKRTAPFLKLCVQVAAVAYVLVVCLNMGSCQAVPILPAMSDLRTLTKKFQDHQIQFSVSCKGGILMDSDLCHLCKWTLSSSSVARIKPIP